MRTVQQDLFVSLEELRRHLSVLTKALRADGYDVEELEEALHLIQEHADGE